MISSIVAQPSWPVTWRAASVAIAFLTLASGLLLWVFTCIGAEYPNELVLQHVPTAIVVVGLFVARGRRWLSPASESLVLLFMTLHLLGARYLYSYVPYDDWSYWLSGKTISACFGFTRNHYDRLVHFAYGLLLVYPVSEVLSRLCRVSAGWRIVGRAVHFGHERAI